MPSYVILINYTEQGLKTFKDLPARLQQVEQAFQQAGGKMTGYYLTLGQYDAVSVVEFPDDETAAKAMLAQAVRGNVKTTTLRAFTRQEAENIAKSL